MSAPIFELAVRTVRPQPALFKLFLEDLITTLLEKFFLGRSRVAWGFDMLKRFTSNLRLMALHD